MSATLRTFIIYWSTGPIDNPDDGQYTVEARSVHEAVQLAEVAGLSPKDIDAVMTKHFAEDLT